MSNELRIVHFPQVPCNPFIVEVKSLEEAKLVYNLLADYDSFQYEERIKPDYANMTLLEELDCEGDWVTWFDEATGFDDINEYFDYKQTN